MLVGASVRCSLEICPGECCHLGEVPGAGFAVGGCSRWLLALSAGRVASTSDSVGGSCGAGMGGGARVLPSVWLGPSC